MGGGKAALGLEKESTSYRTLMGVRGSKGRGLLHEFVD